MPLTDTLACGLLRALVSHHGLNADDAMQLQQQAQRAGISTVRAAVQGLSVNWRQAARSAADVHNAPLADLDVTNATIPNALSDEQLRELLALETWPMSVRGGLLWVAMADPGDLLKLQRIARVSGLAVRAVTVPADALLNRISAGQLPDPPSGDANAATTGDTGSSNATALAGDRSAADRFLRKYVLQAIERGVDTLHIEPHETQYRLRIRPGRVYETLAEIPLAAGQMLSDALSDMSQIDISVSSEHTLRFHIDALQTASGLRLALHRLYPMPQEPTLAALGFSEAEAARLVSAIDTPGTALVMVTSASASLRLAGLHALAHALNREGEHVAVLSPAPLRGLNGCTQVSTDTSDAAVLHTRIGQTLQHDPTRLVLTDFDRITDHATQRACLQWLKVSEQQMLVGISPDHPWLDHPPANGLSIEMDSIHRQHRWTGLLASTRHG